jgi:ribonuclease BN (tRNA processing enzyme)
MRVTVLGAGPACPGPGEACSGFLVEQDQLRIVVDFGTGVASNLQKYCDLFDISCIVITHMHPDHFLDLIPLRYALRYRDAYGSDGRAKLSVLLPPGGTQMLERVALPFAESDSFFPEVMELAEYDPGARLVIEGLVLQFEPVKHYVPAWGVSITGSKKLSYSGDSGICPALQTLSQDADLFICNAGANPCIDDPTNWGHLQPDEAGKIAGEGGAKRLWLSHISRRYDKAAAFDKALTAFSEEAELADFGLAVEL